MNWTNISIFLERFRSFSPPGVFFVDTIIMVIKESTGVILKREEIEKRNNVIYIKNLSSGKKNAIFLNKAKIIDKVKDKLGRVAPNNIYF